MILVNPNGEPNPPKKGKPKRLRTYPPAHFGKHWPDASPRKSRLNDKTKIRLRCRRRNERYRANGTAHLDYKPDFIPVIISVDMDIK